MALSSLQDEIGDFKEIHLAAQAAVLHANPLNFGFYYLFFRL
jgi:hypothetical protein